MQKRGVLFSVILAFLAVLPAAAQSRSLAVVPLNSSGGVSAAELSNLTLYLEAALAETGAFDMVASEERDKIIGELQFSAGGCSDQSCAMEIGRLLSAQYMVFGTVNKSGSSYIISVKKVNVETSRIETNPIDTMLNITPAQMRETTRKLAFQLAGMEQAKEEDRIESFTGSLRLNVDTPGARAVFNLSRTLDSFPVTLEDIPVGEYPLRITAEGYEPKILSVSITKGDITRINESLTRLSGSPARPPRGQGFVSIFTSPPGMNIIIDGDILEETTPLENYAVSEGDHEIILSDFENSFFNDREVYVTVRDGESEELSAEMERKVGKLLVQSNAEGASVFINGKREGAISKGRLLVTSIPTGTIEVALRLDRYRDETRQVSLGASGIQDVTVDLEPLPVRVIFESNPQGAVVTFNGENIGKTPVLREDVPQGLYTYTFSYNGYTTEEKQLEIGGIEDKTIIEDLSASLTVILSDDADREAEVDLDGRYAGVTEDGRLELQNVPFGNHRLDIKKEGYAPVTRNILLGREGETLRTDLAIEAVSYAVLTDPLGASVTVDGVKQEGVTPLTVRLNEGSHDIVVSKPGYLSRRETVVIDAPRGSRLRIPLTEGTDAAALTEYFRERGDELENPVAGILQCRNIAAAFGELLAELDGYEGDLSEPEDYLRGRMGWYEGREALLEETLASQKALLDEQTALRDSLKLRKKSLWTWEALSVAGALAGGAGAVLGALRMPEGDPWTMVTVGSASLAAAGLVAAVVLPGKAALAAADLADAEDNIATLAGRIARLEAGRTLEAPLSEEDGAFVESRVQLRGAIEAALENGQGDEALKCIEEAQTGMYMTEVTLRELADRAEEIQDRQKITIGIDKSLAEGDWREALDILESAGARELLDDEYLVEKKTAAERLKAEEEAAAAEREALEKRGMVLVEGGTFRMGSTSGDDDEEPVHSVTVSSFYLSKYEVTQGVWKEVMGSNPSDSNRGIGSSNPVNNVSWYDAVTFCNKLSERDGLEPAYRISGNYISCDWSRNGYRLPTEAEWEYAARGGNASRGYTYAGSNSIGDVAWYSSNSGSKTHPVGQKRANELGLYDMSGNVWEWCWDRYGDYSGSAQTDPRGVSSGSYRVERGGGWFSGAMNCQVAFRSSYSPGSSYDGIGFRVARRQ